VAREATFAQRVIDWQRRHGRHDLPWQRSRDPYRVWLSEVMLQQTQVATVLGYYERFLQRYPDVDSLAAAALDDVLALWSGLGYYSRARNLHRCAQVIVEQQGSRFPDSRAALERLPGIGRSTAAAIAAFCFGERVSILDGNVKRVLSRAFAFEGDLANARQERALWELADSLLPARDIDVYSQGLMDLGALVCVSREPDCAHCPLRPVCAAAAAGTAARYPVKTRSLKRGRREHVWLRLEWRDKVWLVQRPERGVWAGLWSLPEFDSQPALALAGADWPGRSEPGATFTHTLTHFDWTLHPVHWVLPARTAAARARAIVGRWPTGRWFTLDEALQLGLPAPLRKWLSA
jgi:A/G-specific adenine glycosylase